MVTHSLPTRIRLELMKRAKYAIFLASGRGEARRLVSTLSGSNAPLVVSIVFNEPSLVQVQLETLQRHCAEQCQYLVADNSLDAESSRRIRDISGELGAHYVKLPVNLFSKSRGAAKPGRGSLSHSVALDWVWKHIVTKVEPPVVAVLDHDVFPLTNFSFESLLGGHLAVGPKRQGATRWTTWPGLTVLRFPKLPKRDLTFMPSGDLDSGAGLWESLYQFVPEAEVKFLDREFISVISNAEDPKALIEVIDKSWLHLVDGSGWYDGTGKAHELVSRDNSDEKLSPEVVAIVTRLSEIMAKG